MLKQRDLVPGNSLLLDNVSFENPTSLDNVSLENPTLLENSALSEESILPNDPTLSLKNQAPQLMAENRHVILKYLSELKITNPKFEDVFSETFDNRCFFKPIEKKLDQALSQVEILYTFQKKFLSWKPNISLEDFDYIQKIVDYFFVPVEESNEWEEFKLQLRNEKIESLKESYNKLHDSEEDEPYPIEQIEAEANATVIRLRNLISGALCYKIYRLWVEDNPPLLDQLTKSNAVAFGAIINSIGNADHIISQLKMKADNKIIGPILKLKNELQEIKPTEIPSKIHGRVYDIRKEEYYQIFAAECDKILYHHLLNMFNELKPNHKYVSKKAAEAILGDINMRYKVDITHKTLPFEIFAVVEKLKPYVGKKARVGGLHKLLEYHLLEEKVHSSNESTKRIIKTERTKIVRNISFDGQFPQRKTSPTLDKNKKSPAGSPKGGSPSTDKRVKPSLGDPKKGILSQSNHSVLFPGQPVPPPIKLQVQTGGKSATFQKPKSSKI